MISNSGASMILVAVGNTGILWKRIWIAECHAEPECDLIFKGLGSWQRVFLWQSKCPLDVVARTRRARDELHTRLVVTNVSTVVFATASMGSFQVRTNII